jgi:hypothetical protein
MLPESPAAFAEPWAFSIVAISISSAMMDAQQFNWKIGWSISYLPGAVGRYLELPGKKRKFLEKVRICT